MKKVILMLLIVTSLTGCAVVTVVDTGVSVVGTVVSTSVSVIGSGVKAVANNL